MNGTGNHECLMLPCHVQMEEDRHMIAYYIYDIIFNGKI